MANRRGRPFGSKSTKTIQDEEFRDRMRRYSVTEGGFERFFEELSTLRGEKYVKGYIQALEFYAPKLARHTIAADPDGKPILVISVPYDPNRKDQAGDPTGTNQDKQIAGPDQKTQKPSISIDV